MKRYFVLRNEETRTVFQTQLLEEAPENSVEVDPSVSYDFTLAVFDQYPNPTAVIEGADSDGISSIKTPQYMERLENVVADLRIRAKAAAIGKTGSDRYIISQTELYELKNKIASGEITQPQILALIENEAAEFGLDFASFCTLIGIMYDNAKSKYEVFLFMIERCRTKTQTLIELRQWSQVDAAFALVATLSNADQAAAIMSEILAL